MRRNNSRLLAQSVLLLCLCCLLEADETMAQSVEPRGPNTGEVADINPKGSLKIIQALGLKPITATEKMHVRKGHILILAPNTTAYVVCGDGKPRKLEPGSQPCPCKSPCPPSICGGDSESMMPARPTNIRRGLFPVVLSPRATRLMNLRPTIRWAAINGADENTTYKVSIYGESMDEIWTEKVKAKTSLAYPAKPSLTPGRIYKVVVTSGERSSEEERTPGLGFTTLDEKEAQKLATEELKIKSRGFSDTQTRFLISMLYKSERLYAEAIEQFEELYNHEKEPVVARVLGDSYSAIGLGREAEKNYKESLRGQDPEDLEGLALTQMKMATIYEYLGMFNEAVQKLEEAIKAYGQLGDSVLVQELSARVQNLKRNK